MPDPVLGSNLLSPKQIALVRDHLSEVIASHAFAGSKRTQDFLQLIVEHALEGDFDSLRERMIGAEMFGRPIGYDTGSDSVVRVKATEVRKRLVRFYFEAKGKQAVRIELPSGSYVPKFHFEPFETAASSAAEVVPLASGAHTAVHGDEPSAGMAEAKLDDGARQPARRSHWRPRILIASLVGLLVIAAISYVGWKRWYDASHAQTGIRSIAILPLENLSGVPAQEYFADGMTEELINDLGQVSTLRVISLTSAMSYKGTKKKLPEIARELAVDAVVEGGILREGDQVRISAQLIDARTDRPIWAHTYVRHNRKR